MESLVLGWEGRGLYTLQSWVLGNKPPLHERGKPVGAGYLWAASLAGVMSP